MKEILRKLVWTTCYLAKASLACFEPKSEVGAKNQVEVMKTVLNSKLFSGGLSVSGFSTVFSQQFNKQFSSIVNSQQGIMIGQRSQNGAKFT